MTTTVALIGLHFLSYSDTFNVNIYNASCLQRVRRYLGLYNVCSVSVISVASGHSEKHRHNQ